MNHSEKTAALAEALNKAQPQIVAPVKNKTVKVASARGSYSFSYATLDSVMESVRGPLAANGLSFSQGVRVEQGKPVLSTMLLHSSGEWIESLVPLDVQAAGMQAMGSAISYARRYGLSNVLGITADEDDDGNSADGNTVTSGPSPADIKKLKDKIATAPDGNLVKTVDAYLKKVGAKSPYNMTKEQFDYLIKELG